MLWTDFYCIEEFISWHDYMEISNNEFCMTEFKAYPKNSNGRSNILKAGTVGGIAIWWHKKVIIQQQLNTTTTH